MEAAQAATITGKEPTTIDSFARTEEEAQEGAQLSAALAATDKSTASSTNLLGTRTLVANKDKSQEDEEKKRADRLIAAKREARRHQVTLEHSLIGPAVSEGVPFRYTPEVEVHNTSQGRLQSHLLNKYRNSPQMEAMIQASVEDSIHMRTLQLDTTPLDPQDTESLDVLSAMQTAQFTLRTVKFPTLLQKLAFAVGLIASASFALYGLQYGAASSVALYQSKVFIVAASALAAGVLSYAFLRGAEYLQGRVRALQTTQEQA